MAKNTPSPAWADSKQAWLDRVHDAVLPSGVKVTYRDLTLGEMIAFGELPSELLEIAVGEWDEPGATARRAAAVVDALPEQPTKKEQADADATVRELGQKLAEVNRELIAAALVEPALTVAELARVPFADLELLSGLINRSEHLDAAGRLVGVAAVQRFRVVLEAHGHEPCATGCEACQTAGRALATLR